MLLIYWILVLHSQHLNIFSYCSLNSNWVYTCKLQSRSNGTLMTSEDAFLDSKSSSMKPISLRDATAQKVAPPVTLNQFKSISVTNICNKWTATKQKDQQPRNWNLIYSLNSHFWTITENTPYRKMRSTNWQVHWADNLWMQPPHKKMKLKYWRISYPLTMRFCTRNQSKTTVVWLQGKPLLSKFLNIIFVKFRQD